MKLLHSLVPALALFGASCSALGPGGIIDLTDANAPLTERTVVDGLKEGLRIGTERTTDVLGAPGGFAGNDLLRIRLPEEVQPLASTLRKIGLGSQVDGFEDTMNRAAERAAGEALDVFVAAVRSMSIADAFAILDGDDDAATRYFRERTTDALTERFSPIVSGTMREVGVYRLYSELQDTYNRIPLTKPVAVDLEAYITERALDGLFNTLALEEKRIREDPLARTTALLKRVFGRNQNRQSLR